MALMAFIFGLILEPSAADEGRPVPEREGHSLFLHLRSYVFAMIIVVLRFYARTRWTIWGKRMSEASTREREGCNHHGAGDGTWIIEFDLEGRLTRVTQPRGVAGRKTPILPGRFFHAFLPEREVPRAIQAFITVMMGRRVRDMRLEMLTEDGFSVPVSAHFLPLFRDREVVGVRGLFRDLLQSEEPEKACEALAQSSLAGIYIIQNGKLRLVNPHFQRCTGYAEKDLLDTDPLRLVHPEDREMVSRRAVMMLKGERMEPYEFRLLTRDGGVRPVREIVTSVRYRGQRAVLGNYVRADARCRQREGPSCLSPV